MPTLKDGRYYGVFARRLIAQGYRVVPLKPRHKAPCAANWQSREFDGYEPEFVDSAHGLGLVCGVGAPHALVAVDIDVTHPKLNVWARNWCRDNVGLGLERVGYAPKLVVLYKGTPDMQKMFSAEYLDFEDRLKPNGKENKQRIEILRRGQQVVAMGIHPDTGREYQWEEALLGHPLDTRLEDLPIISVDQIQELIRQFEQAAEIMGLAEAGRGSVRGRAVIRDPSAEPDEITANDVGFVEGVTLQDAREALDFLDPSMSRNSGWLNVGMALHHQFRGDSEAFEVWDDWSSTGTTYVSTEDLAKDWESFGKGCGDGRAVVTYRTIIKMVAEAKGAEAARERKELLEKVASACRQATDTRALLNEVLLFATQSLGMDMVAMLDVRDMVRGRYRELSSRTLSQPEYNRALNTARIEANREAAKRVVIPRADDLEGWSKRTPWWARDWVYVASDKCYWNLRLFQSYCVEGFRAFCDFRLTSEGYDNPNSADYLRKHMLLPVVNGVRYAPQEGLLFSPTKGETYVNSFNRGSFAPIPEEWTSEGRAAARAVKDHIGLNVTGAKGGWNRECQLFANFLRHNIEFPGVKIPWVVLLQGVEGTGKSFFHGLMGRILGQANVGVVTGVSVMASASTGFNSWAEGRIFCAIEEIRLVGHNRHDVVNALKDKISNPEIEIVRKGKDPIVVPNTTNYLLLTNYRDAVPIDNTDRRYFIIFSRFPMKRMIAEGSVSSYFNELFELTTSEPGAVAKWLLSVPYHADFQPCGRAPQSEDTALAAEINADPLRTEILDLIATGQHLGISEEVILPGVLKDVLRFCAEDTGEAVTVQTLGRILHRLGYVPVEKVRVPEARQEDGTLGGRRVRAWVQIPEGGLPEGMTLRSYADRILKSRWVRFTRELKGDEDDDEEGEIVGTGRAEEDDI